MRFDDKKWLDGVSRPENNASTVAMSPMTLKGPFRKSYAEQKKI